MENSARIYVNLSSKEFEVEGSEQFVKDYYEKIETLMATVPSPTPSTIPETGGTPPTGISPYSGVQSTFGEYLQLFPKIKTNVERILIAGYFDESQSPDHLFTTETANKLLIEQSINLSNASDSVASNKKAGRIFATKGKFKVSQKGIEYINKLREK